MVSIQEAKEILKLHEKGISIREISRKTGVSRYSIDRILEGSWKLPKSYNPLLPATNTFLKGHRTPYPTNDTQLARCERCGAIVLKPCISCNLRDFIAKNPDLERLQNGEITSDFPLELHPEDYKRYLAIREEHIKFLMKFGVEKT